MAPETDLLPHRHRRASVALWDASRRRLALLILIWKAASLALVLFALRFFPAFDLREYQNDIHWPRSGPPILSTHFATWDGAHYLYLSEEGYRAGSASCAFYPLWPMLIRVAAPLAFGSHFWAGLLLANLLSVAGILLFHQFVADHHGLPAANVAAVLLLAFPGAFFFSFIYTESLFFLLIVLFFRFLLKEQWLGVGITGFLLPLTKAVGVFCVFPLLVHLFLKRKPLSAYMFAYYGPLLGYACYFGFMWAAVGNPLEGFDAQRFYPNHPSVAHLFDPAGFLQKLLLPVQLHGMLNSALDRLLFLVLVGSLYPLYKLDKRYFAYALFVGVVPAMSSWFLSYTRNVMMVFPLFILLALLYSEIPNPNPNPTPTPHPAPPRNSNRRFLLRCTVVFMATIQAWLLLRHVNFIWAA